MTKNTDNDYFDALCKEAQFTVEMLCSGYTEIRKANYAKRGVYFQSFTSLSTGVRVRRFRPHLSPVEIAKNKFN